MLIGIDDVVGFYVLSFLFIIFVIIFGITAFAGGGVSEEIEALQILGGSDSVYALLDSEVNGMTFADLIVKSIENNDYADLKREMGNALDGTGMCWYLKLYDVADLKKPLEKVYRDKCVVIAREEYSGGFQDAMIPSYGNIEGVRVEFRIAGGRVN